MSLWEFVACMDGWKAMNGIKPKGEGHSEDDLRRLGIKGFDT